MVAAQYLEAHRKIGGDKGQGQYGKVKQGQDEGKMCYSYQGGKERN